MFVGQRIRWVKKWKQGAHICIDQEKKVEELVEIQHDKSARLDLALTADMHRQYRSFLGQINWLQSRTQYQACYQFSRCASAASAPTIADVKEINKLVRTIRNTRIDRKYWTLKAPCRILGYPDASYRNNSDSSSQRGQCIFIAELRSQRTISPKGSLVDYESQKVKRTTLSTTVAEL